MLGKYVNNIRISIFYFVTKSHSNSFLIFKIYLKKNVKFDDPKHGSLWQNSGTKTISLNSPHSVSGIILDFSEQRQTISHFILEAWHAII